MSADKPVGPAVLVNRLGQGTVLTFTCSPDAATASEHHVVEARKLLADAVQFLHPRPRIRITGPTFVEAVVTDDPSARTLRVHLLGYQSPPQTIPARERPYVLPATIEDTPLYRVKVEKQEPLRSAAALHSTTAVDHRDSIVEAVVSDVHETLLLRY
jgi:hypothetical protein